MERCSDGVEDPGAEKALRGQESVAADNARVAPGPLHAGLRNQPLCLTWNGRRRLPPTHGCTEPHAHVELTTPPELDNQLLTGRGLCGGRGTHGAERRLCAEAAADGRGAAEHARGGGGAEGSLRGREGGGVGGE
jgi:hypothetical protein